MIMKGNMIMIATMAMMGGMTPNGSLRTDRYTDIKTRKRKEDSPLPDSIGIPDVIPKGHTTEPVNFEFEWQNCILRTNCTITYGTVKSRLKKISSTRGYLQEYLKRTTMEGIRKFGQFEIEELPVKDGPLKRFIPKDNQ